MLRAINRYRVSKFESCSSYGSGDLGDYTSEQTDRQTGGQRGRQADSQAGFGEGS